MARSLIIEEMIRKHVIQFYRQLFGVLEGVLDMDLIPT